MFKHIVSVVSALSATAFRAICRTHMVVTYQPTMWLADKILVKAFPQLEGHYRQLAARMAKTVKDRRSVVPVQKEWMRDFWVACGMSSEDADDMLNSFGNLFPWHLIDTVMSGYYGCATIEGRRATVTEAHRAMWEWLKFSWNLHMVVEDLEREFSVDSYVDEGDFVSVKVH